MAATFIPYIYFFFSYVANYMFYNRFKIKFNFKFLSFCLLKVKQMFRKTFNMEFGLLTTSLNIFQLSKYILKN